MKALMTIFISLTSSFIFAQQDFKSDKNKVVIDSQLENDLFYASKNSIIHYPAKVTITNSTTGKTDTFHKFPKDIDIIVNANVVETSNNHYNFDNCASFLRNDTLIIQLQNNSALEQKPIFLDKIFVYIVKGMFYTKYKTITTEYWLSPYWLVLKKQELTLKNMVNKKGQRLMGQLVVQYADQNPKAKNKLLTFKGAFDCQVQ